MVAEREAKSVSVEGTYDTDLTDRRLMEGLLTRQAGEVAERLRKHGLSGRTVTIKVRLHDFTTLSRSTTLAVPHRQHRARSPGSPAGCSPTSTPPAGVRLLGVGVSGLADWIQEDLFGDTTEQEEEVVAAEIEVPRSRRSTWAPGMDVVHAEHGPRLGVGLRARAW